MGKLIEAIFGIMGGYNGMEGLDSQVDRVRYPEKARKKDERGNRERDTDILNEY